MKRLIDFLEDTVLPFGCVFLAIGIPTWLLYKIFVGVYHLLDKIIDKA